MATKEIMGIPVDDPTPETQQLLEALAKVIEERTRQLAKWGTQRHDFPVWLVVLQEEVGEFAQALLNHRSATFAGDREARRIYRLQMMAEAIQIAAVAVAMVEHLDELVWGGGDGEQASSAQGDVQESRNGSPENSLRNQS